MAFTFFSTLLMYNLQRMHKRVYQPFNADNTRHVWIESNRRFIWALIVISGAVLLLLLPLFSWDRIIGLACLGIISFLYSFRTKFGNLRDIPGTKIFWIAFVWAATIFVFVTDFKAISKEDYLLLTYNFVFIFAITIPFDIRDLDFDEKDYKTIPQVLGVTTSRVISFSLVWIAFIILCFLLQNFSIFLSLIYGIFALLCLFSTPQRNELYFSGIIDFTISVAAISLFLYVKVDFFHF